MSDTDAFDAPLDASPSRERERNADDSDHESSTSILSRISQEFLPENAPGKHEHFLPVEATSRESYLERVVEIQPVERKEIRGWYFYDFANSVFFTTVLGSYLPILLLQLANLSSNCTDCQLFAAGDGCRDPLKDCGFTTTEDTCVTWDEGSDTYKTVNVSEICSDPTFISTAKNDCKVNFLFDVSPASYVLVASVISVFIQVPVFLSIGGIADYSHYRKRLLTLTTYAGCIFTALLFLADSAGGYWGAGVLLILSNVCFGAAIIFYNAYLPILVEAHTEVLEIDKRIIGERASGGESGGEREREREVEKLVEEKNRVVDEISNRVSQRGQVFGYVGGLSLTIINVAITFIFSDEDDNERGLPTNTFGTRFNLLLAAIWWFSFSTFFTFRHVKPRPSAPLPRGETYISVNFHAVRDTFRALRVLPHTKRFLIGFFLYSDSMQTMSQIAVIFAQEELKMSTVEVSVIFVLVQLSAVAGCWLFLHLQRRFHKTPLYMLQLHLIIMIMLLTYGMIGYIPGTCFGLKSTWEMYIFTVVYGLNVGSQAFFSRSVFAQFCPKGMEAQFFTLYEITDRGSTLIGPLALVAIKEATDSLRLGLLYLLVMFVVPLLVVYTVNFARGVEDSNNYKKPSLSISAPEGEGEREREREREIQLGGGNGSYDCRKKQ